MRILRNLVQIASLQLMLLAPAHAFDGTPASNEQITPERMTASEALRLGARKYYSGDKQAALDSCATRPKTASRSLPGSLARCMRPETGLPRTTTRLSNITIRLSAFTATKARPLRRHLVSSAFVALGKYYMTGIKNTQVKANPARARQIFTHAASYFGDAEAQYELGQLYRENNDLMAVRWFNLAALKGHIGAQALLGETLFNLADSWKTANAA
ncbi:sel1 repeat family protein [Pannonibacter sp. Pt2-lr]